MAKKLYKGLTRERMAAAPELLETVRMLAGYIADNAVLGDEMSVREFLRRNVDGVLAKARPDLVE